MSGEPTPPYGRFWSLPDGGNWEGGTVDANGNRWHHAPWEGWKQAPPNPYLYQPATHPRRIRIRVQARRAWWDRLLRRPARWIDRGTYDLHRWGDQ